MSDRFSTFIKNEIDNINLHLPRKVLSLKLIEKLEKPKIMLRDGTFNEMDVAELEKIRNKFSEKELNQYKGQILLPIIITRRRDMGQGAFTVGGSDANLYIVLSLFEDLPGYSEWKKTKKDNYTFYRVQLRKIRKELPSTTVIALT